MFTVNGVHFHVFVLIYIFTSPVFGWLINRNLDLKWNFILGTPFGFATTLITLTAVFLYGGSLFIIATSIIAGLIVFGLICWWPFGN